MINNEITEIMNTDKALELARKAYPNNEELRVAYMLGLNEGYELHRDEMMKDAVEGKVFMSFAPGHNQMVMADVDLPTNTKVRIIIVKEDEK